MYSLRGYQLAAVNAAQQARRNALLVLPTGTGKTVLVAELIRRTKGRVLFAAHRGELLDQAQETIWAHTGVLPGRIQAAEHSPARVTVASVASLHAARRESVPRPDLLVIDECFPAGTLVDGKPIEDIRAGDVVMSFDPTAGAIMRRVTRTFKTRPSGLVSVRFNNGKTITCTPGHPFYSPKTGEYISALDLKRGTMVLTTTGERDGISIKIRGSSEMHMVRGRCLPSGPTEIQAGRLFKKRAGLLLRRMQGCLREKAQLGNNGEHQQKICIRAHEKEQPNASSGCTRESVDKASGNGLETQNAGWERPGANHSRTGASICARVGDKCNYSYRPKKKRWTPDTLQNRRRKQQAEDRGRGGRNEPQISNPAGTRQKKRAFLGVAWVEGVEVHKPGGCGGFGPLCPDGFVYNLEVEGEHNYFADGVLVHNCHHATARTYRELIDWAGCQVVGVTATPYRLDEDEDTSWKLGSIFGQRPAYTYPLMDAVRDGYLVPIRQFGVQTAASMDGVGMRGGEFAASGLAELDTPERNALVADSYRRLCDGRKAICFSVTVAHARNMATALQAFGIRADATWGGDPDREQKIADYRMGEIRVICNCGILTEGFDDPDTSALLMARPTASRSLYVQMAGRGLRPSQGKDDCLIVDFLDVGQRHALATQSALRLAGAPGEVPIAEHDAGGRVVTEAVQEQLQSLEDMQRQIEIMPLAWTSKEITPRWSMEAMGLQSYEPTAKWELKPATKKQITTIRRFKLELRRDINRGEASALIDRLITLDNEHPEPATQKQLGYMRWKRIPIPEGCTKRQAGALIGKYNARMR